MIVKFLIVVGGISRNSAFTCNYSEHFTMGYSCELAGISYLDPEEAVLIEGNHLEGHGDTDVLGMFARFQSHTNLSYIPKEIWTTFVNLEQLLLGDVNMESIEGSFKVCEKVTLFDFSGNHLKLIESQGFEKCQNLLFLDLGLNQISAITVGAFEGLSKLETLMLSGNPIAVMAPEMFASLSNLQNLWLRDLLVTELHPQLLTNMKKLKHFEFGSQVEMDVSKIQAGTFKSLPVLEIVSFWFSQTNMTEIEAAAFEDLQSLNRLSLSSNKIQRLSADSFINVPNLSTLNADENQMYAIERTFFTTFSKLQVINLLGNECISKRFIIGSPFDEGFLQDMEQCFTNYDEPIMTTTMLTTTFSTSTPVITTSTTTTTETTTTIGLTESTDRTTDTTLGTSSIIPSFLSVLGGCTVYFMFYTNYGFT